MFCVRIMPAVRSSWNVLRLIRPVSFPLSGKERRLAECCVPIPRGSGSPFVRSHDFVRLSDRLKKHGSMVMPCVPFAAFGVRLRLSLFLCQEKRNGLRCVAFLFRAGRNRLSTFSDVVRLSSFVGSLRACAFLYGDPDGVRGNAETRDTGNEVGGAAWVRFCAIILALQCFRGESVGG